MSTQHIPSAIVLAPPGYITTQNTPYFPSHPTFIPTTTTGTLLHVQPGTTKIRPIHTSHFIDISDVHFAWKTLSTSSLISVTTWCVFSFFYYMILLLHNIFDFPLPNDQPIYYIFTEKALVQVTCTHWIITVCILGLSVIRSYAIPMPIFFVSTVISMNGSLSLLAINVKKILNGQVEIGSAYFLLILMLTLIGVLNVAVYSISVHLHYREKRRYKKTLELLAASRQVHHRIREHYTQGYDNNYIYTKYNIV